MMSRFVPKAVGGDVYNPQRRLISWKLSQRRGVTVPGQDSEVGQSIRNRGHGDRAENLEIEPQKQS